MGDGVGVWVGVGAGAGVGAVVGDGDMVGVVCSVMVGVMASIIDGTATGAGVVAAVVVEVTLLWTTPLFGKEVTFGVVVSQPAPNNGKAKKERRTVPLKNLCICNRLTILSYRLQAEPIFKLLKSKNAR